MITLEDVYKKFGTQNVLKSFNLTVSKGDFLIITGKSGSGKSTLLNIIGLLEKPDSGKVTICNRVNPSYKSKEGRYLLSHEISYVFQNFGLIDDLSVLENLLLGIRVKGNKKQIVNMSLNKLGISNLVDKKVFQLSGGEQQRVAIAKIYMKNPSIILADEPTGSLDSQNKKIVMENLKILNESGKTIVMVSHDLELVNYANRRIVL